MLYWIWAVSVGFRDLLIKILRLFLENYENYNFNFRLYLCFFGGIFITAVGNIDTSGISMLEEVKKTLDRRELKVH